MSDDEPTFYTADGDEVEEAPDMLELTAEDLKNSGIASEDTGSVLPLAKLMPNDHTAALIVDGVLVARIEGPGDDTPETLHSEAEQ